MSTAIAAATLAKSGEGAKAGPIGLAVILLLCIACYFLFKSMSKHMREVRENFPTELPPSPGAAKADLVKADLTKVETVRAPSVSAPPVPAPSVPAPPAIEPGGPDVTDPTPDEPAV